MTWNKLIRGRSPKRAARVVAGALVAVGASGIFGCLDRPIAPNEPRTTTTIVERLTQSAVDKIDLLLAIDNSRSMADKQQILALAVPDLVEGLVNPRCVNRSDPAQTPVKVGSPTEECPAGMERDFEPVLDIHIGIISSSLGGHGSTDICVPGTNGADPSVDDKAHLLTRSLTGTVIETYQNKSFLAWDPTQKLDLNGQPDQPDPLDGEADLNVDDEAALKDVNGTALIPQLKDLVLGVNQIGCGFEAQLESWYRFLIDPNPFETLTVKDGVAVAEGTDQTLLQQRKDFLRPDSLLAVILLADENDCSIRDGADYHFILRGAPMFAARAECATNPNDPCCASCAKQPAECPADPTCDAPDGTPRLLDPAEDHINRRCFDQKRRFGVDFLYPTDRYVQGLTQLQVSDRDGNLVANPIFSDLNPDDDLSNIRDVGLVFLAGIVGVPWQDIARVNSSGAPDLVNGLDQDGNPVGGFKNADELIQETAGYPSTWDIILGDPANLQLPADPHMIESTDPRSGTNPITMTSLAPPGSPNGTDPINGHEWTITTKDDLQYACIFPLLPGTERDCKVDDPCDCTESAAAPDDNNTNPLCELDPTGGTEPTFQDKAKAYPGLRQLQVLRGIGKQGIVGSVCPVQVENDVAPDYGYRPAIGAIIDRLKTVLGGQCLPRTLQPDDNGQVSCLIVEVRNAQGACSCNYAARQDIQPGHEAAAQAALEDPIAQSAGWDCACEVTQLQGEELTACQTQVNTPVTTSAGDVNGWCYVDATTIPPTGDPAIVASCPATERRIIRFVGTGEAQAGATLFIICSGEQAQ